MTYRPASQSSIWTYLQNFVIVQVLAGDGGIVGAALLVALLVHAAVDGVQQALGQVCAAPKNCSFSLPVWVADTQQQME